MTNDWVELYCTQNLVIGKRLDWDFLTFMIKMAPITVIVWPVGVFTCLVLEGCYKKGGFGVAMPVHVRQVLREFVEDEYGKMHSLEMAEMYVQAVACVFLVIALCAHLTEVGFVGLGIAIFVTAMNGECEEHDVAHAFLEAMPFVSLLVVFFAVVAIIEEQHLFAPIIDFVLGMDVAVQPVALYMVNGVLSAVSDNVFVVRPICCHVHFHSLKTLGVRPLFQLTLQHSNTLHGNARRRPPSSSKASQPPTMKATRTPWHARPST